MHESGLLDLEAVLAVARHGGFRPAALALGLSPTALSNAVAGLERRLGVRLFHRTTRSVALTEAGERFVARAAPAVAELRGAMEEARSARQRPAGTLRLNAALGAARMVFAPLVVEFLRRYPEMNVEIVTEGRLVDIVAARFDAGLRPSELVPRDMVRVPLDGVTGGALRMAVVAAPTYLDTHAAPKSPADLAAHDCIRARNPSGSTSPWEFAARGGEATQMDVPGRLVLDSPALMRDAALAGLGLAYLAEWHVREDIAAGHLVPVLQDWVPVYPGLALYFPQGRHMPAGLRVLVDLVHELAAGQ